MPILDYCRECDTELCNDDPQGVCRECDQSKPVEFDKDLTDGD